MYDRGDMSVGIRPTHIEIDTNIRFDKEDYEQFYDLARDWFDLGDPVTICIGDNKGDMECHTGKIMSGKKLFWKEEN